MINKLTRYAACLLTILSLGFMTACEKENPNTAVPSIEISGVLGSTTALSFDIIPLDATSYAYAVTTPEEFTAGTYTLKHIQENTKKRYKEDGLTNGTKYVIVAVAYNGSLTSEVRSVVTRTSTEAPTIKDIQITASDDSATITVKASAGTTKLTYTIYTKATADAFAQQAEQSGIPDDGSWKKWAEQKVTDPENIVIESTDMPADNYLFEVIPVANLTMGNEAVVKPFNIMVQDRPYARISILSSAFDDVMIDIEKNELAAKYYVGLDNEQTLDVDKLLAMLKTEEGAKYLKTDDYTGSLLTLVGETFTGKWLQDEVMVAWIIGCKEDGSFVASINNINKVMFKVPGPTYQGAGTVSAVVDEVNFTTFKATLTPKDCKKYYYLAGMKSEMEAKYSDDKNLIEAGLLLETPVTTGEPTIIEQKGCAAGTEYVVYAIGMDNTGKLGALMTQVIKTKSVDFNSKANITVEVTKLEPINVSLTVTPNADCVSMDYIIITNANFLEYYNGSTNQVLSAMALGEAVGGTTEHVFATQGNTIDMKNVSSNMFYLFFAVPKDKDGGMGRIKEETAIKTPKFDVTGTAEVAVTNLRKSGSRITCTVTPNESCSGYYLLPVLKNRVTVTNSLIETILTTTADRTYKYGEGGEKAPVLRSYSQAIDPEQNIYILCRDMEGKYNDPLKYYIDSNGKLVDNREVKP